MPGTRRTGDHEAGASNPGLVIAYTLDQAAFDLHRSAGRPIYVLRGLEGHNFEVEGVRLEGPGVAPF